MLASFLEFSAHPISFNSSSWTLLAWLLTTGVLSQLEVTTQLAIQCRNLRLIFSGSHADQKHFHYEKD